MTLSEQIAREMEACSAATGLATSTIGALAGQGGHFYERCRQGKRCWPETADKVRAVMAELREKRG